MDDLIISYISVNYTPEMQQILLSGLKLLDDVEYIEHLDILNQYIMSEQDIHPVDIHLHVIGTIQGAINAVLKMHTITCNSDTHLSTRIDILNSLLEVQSLEVYQGLLDYLRSDASDDDKLIEAIRATSILTEIQIMDSISEYDPKILTHLTQLLENRETNQNLEPIEGDTTLQVQLISRLHCFSDAIEDYTMLGNALIESGFMIGKPLMSYLPFVKDLWSQFSSDTIAKQIFSLILITEEGLDNPLLVFRRYSSTFTSDPSLILKLDTELSNLNSFFQRKLIEKGVR